MSNTKPVEETGILYRWRTLASHSSSSVDIRDDREIWMLLSDTRCHDVIAPRGARTRRTGTPRDPSEPSSLCGNCSSGGVDRDSSPGSALADRRPHQRHSLGRSGREFDRSLSPQHAMVGLISVLLYLASTLWLLLGSKDPWSIGVIVLVPVLWAALNLELVQSLVVVVAATITELAVTYAPTTLSWSDRSRREGAFLRP
jgi:hypothetical protein